MGADPSLRRIIRTLIGAVLVVTMALLPTAMMFPIVTAMSLGITRIRNWELQEGQGLEGEVCLRLGLPLLHTAHQRPTSSCSNIQLLACLVMRLC